MLELDFVFFALAMPAVAFAAISKSGFGSGASFAAASILAIILPPGQALGIMLPLLLVVDFASLKSYWGKWSAPDVKVMIIGSIPGVLAGVVFWRIANDDVIRFFIGVISILFVVWQTAVARKWLDFQGRRLSEKWGYLGGAAAGFTSFISHAGGPPAAVYLLSRGFGKTEYQATAVIVFWFINIAKAIPYAFLGIFTVETLIADLYLVPAALFGTWVGVRAHHMIPAKHFFKLTYVLLLMTGTKLIWDALT